MASPHSKSTWGAEGLLPLTEDGSGATSVFSRLTVLERSPPSLSDSSRKISTLALEGLGPLNSGGATDFLVVSVFHSAVWVTAHSFGLKGNSTWSSSVMAPPALGSRIVSDALRTLSRVVGTGCSSAPGGRRGRLEEPVVGQLERLDRHLRRLDVEGRARPPHRDDPVEAPRHHLLLVGADGHDLGGGAVERLGHVGQPDRHLLAVGADRPADLDVRVLEAARELVDERVVAALLPGLDDRLHAEALEAVPQAEVLAVDLHLEHPGDRGVAAHGVRHLHCHGSLSLAAHPGAESGPLHVEAQLRAEAPADAVVELVGQLVELGRAGGAARPAGRSRPAGGAPPASRGRTASTRA